MQKTPRDRAGELDHFDPHKWLFVPSACGATLVRDGGASCVMAFDITPEYLSGTVVVLMLNLNFSATGRWVRGVSVR